MGAEAAGLAAGAGLAMTTAGWGMAGVGWMGCTCEKIQQTPPSRLPGSAGGQSRGRAKAGMESFLTQHTFTCAPSKG